MIIGSETLKRRLVVVGVLVYLQILPGHSNANVDNSVPEKGNGICSCTDT